MKARHTADVWALIALVGAFLLATIPPMLLHSASGVEAVRFIAVHTALILVPGLVLGRGFLPQAPAHAALAIGSIFATALLVFAGIIEFRFGVHHAILAGPLGACVLGIVLVRRASGAVVPPPARGELVAAAAVFLALLAAQTIALTLPATRASAQSVGAYYPDSLWTVGNTYSIERWGLPMRDIRFSGTFLGYHVAENIYQSAVMRYGGINPFDLHFALEPSIDRMTLALVCLTAPSVYRKTGWRAGLLLGVGVLFTTPFTGDGDWLLYANPLSYAYSLGPFFLFHAVLFRSPEARIRAPSLQLALAFGLAVASKGNLLLLVPAGLGGLFLWQRRKELSVRSTVLTGFLIVFVGAFVYLTLFRTPAGAGYGIHMWPVNPEGRIYVLLFDRLKLGAAAKVIFAVWNILRPLLTNTLSLTAALGSVLLIMLFVKREARDTIKGEPLFAYAVAFAAASMVLISVFEFVGGYVYFFHYAQLLFLLLVAFTFEEWSTVWRPFVRATAALIAAGMALFVVEGVRWGRHWGSFPGPTRGLDPRATVDASELAGLDWLRAHARPDDTFLGNRHLYTHEQDSSLEVGRFFGYSGFSGLQAYAEGEGFRPAGIERERAQARWSHVDEFFNEPDPQRRAEMLAPMHVQWVIQCRRFKDLDLTQTPGLSVVFDEPTIRIFRVDAP